MPLQCSLDGVSPCPSISFFEQLGVLGDAVGRLVEHRLQFGVACLRCDLLQSTDHLVVGRPQVFQFVDIKLFEFGDFGHDVAFVVDE